MKRSKITPLPAGQNDKVLIGDELNGSERVEYICSSCHCGPLVTITDKAGNTDRFCRQCSAVYNMEDDTVRHRHRLTVPEETEPAISTTPTIGADAVAIHHEPELKGSFKALRDRGIKITHYQEGVG